MDRKRRYSAADEALARAIRAQARTDSMTIAMGDIVAALEAGGDPHAITEDGRCIMEELVGAHNPYANHSNYTSDARGILLCFLMTRGANPLAWPEAFAKLPERSLAVAHDVLEGLVAQENAGAGCRAPDGGNALHCLARHPPAWEDLRGWLMGKPRGADRVHPTWIAQQDGTGKTIVHHLMKVPEKHCDEGQRIARWNICKQLLERQDVPDFLEVDQEGVSAAAMIVDAASFGHSQAWEEMPSLRQAILRWRACLEQDQLEQGTPSAMGPGRAWRL